MRKMSFLFAACSLTIILASAQQVESGFKWPVGYGEHVKKLPTINEKVISLTDAVDDLHNQSMRDEANSHWLQTQIDLIVKYVDVNRPTVDNLNVQVKDLERENDKMKSQIQEFQTAVCPFLLRAAASQDEKQRASALCR